MNTQRVFFGTSGTDGQGILRADFDPASGSLSEATVVSEIPKPSWLRPRGKSGLLSVSQPREKDAMGQVVSFTIGADGSLSEVGRASTQGGNPVALDCCGNAIVVANYLGGSAASFRTGEQGMLHPAGFYPFPASEHGPVTDRQDKSYAHDAVFSPGGAFAFINDLGCDRIRIFSVDVENAMLTPHGEWHSVPGAGPRHITFHPNGRWVYNINEIGCTIDQLEWNPSKGTLRTLSSVDTLPAGVSKKGVRACETVFGKDARLLYAANRAHEDFVVYSVDGATGALTEVQRVANPGKEARHIAMDPGGRWFLVANQFSHQVIVLPVDANTGLLGKQAGAMKIQSPSCILFA